MITTAIRLWQSTDDYITLDYAAAQAHYEQSGERIADRNGLVHRLAPGVERYPVWLTLSILPEELCALNNVGAPLRMNALDWLEASLRGGSLLLVYARGETLDNAGGALVRKLGYYARIEEISGGLAALPGSGVNAQYAGGIAAGEPLLLRLLVIEDGAFSDFDSYVSYAPYEPARP